MKQLFLLVALIKFNGSACAQNVFSNEVNSTLQSVILDLNNNFRNIKGEQLSQKGSQSEYNSKAIIPGSFSSSITENKRPARSTYIWKTTLYSIKDFNEAKLKFREVFEQINNSIIKGANEKPYILSGKYEEPRRPGSTSIQLSLLPETPEMKSVTVEVSLQHNRDWIITLRVFDKTTR